MNRDAHIARLQAILDVVMPHLLAEYVSGGGSPEFRQAVEAAAALAIGRKVRSAVQTPQTPAEELVFLKKSRRPTKSPRNL